MAPSTDTHESESSVDGDKLNDQEHAEDASGAEAGAPAGEGEDEASEQSDSEPEAEELLDGSSPEDGEEDESSEQGNTEAASSSEASENEAEASQDEHEAVGAVKLPTGADIESGEDEASDEDSQSGDSGGEDEEQDEAESESSSSVAEEWEDASAGEGEGEAPLKNHCFFCNQSEEEDPSEDFEEYLACKICGNNAHQQCAREDGFLNEGDNIKAWHCPDCLSEQGDSVTTDDAKERRLSATSQVPKDLLPAPRAGVKPGAHSIFNDLIIDEDPLDGSRPLRKRKASSEALELSSIASSKKRRKGHDGHSSSEEPTSRPSSSHKQRTRRRQMNGTTESSTRERLATEASSSTQHRPRRQKSTGASVRVLEKRGKKKLLLAFRLDMSRIRETRLPKKHRRSSAAHHALHRISHLPATQYASPFYTLHTAELDEGKSKPYGGILTETQADTTKTFPTSEDRAKFDDARRRYEEEWKIKTAALEAESELKNRASTKISGPPSKIKCINFGGYEIDTWYAAPYPEEYSRNRVLFICEFCLKYMPSDYVAWRHKLKCPTKHPPGDEIYRDASISVFEVDGRKNPVYCQNLCLLAKLFLGSKTLYYDVEPFLFYIMTEYDEYGYHFVGYFSKEKRPSSMNNVSCILTLPIHQRKGYGNLLIDFSYLLTRVEQKSGSPEKPLSDMGLVSYRNYWRLILAKALLEQRDPISIAGISDRTGMTADDIIAGLEALRALVRDPVTKSYALRIDRAFLKETIQTWETKGYVTLNENALIWTPYIMGRNNLASYDRGAPISTVAPRDDEDEEESAIPTVQPEEGVQIEVQQEAITNGAGASTAAEEDAAVGPSMVLAEATTSITESNEGFMSLEAAMIDAATPLRINGVVNSNDDAGSLVKQDKIAPDSDPDPTIPPSRYEIYPPIPGTAIRRKYYRATPKKTTTLPLGQAPRRGRPPGRTNANKGPKLKAPELAVNDKGKNEATSTGALTPSRRTRSKVTEDQSSVAEGQYKTSAGDDVNAGAELAAGETDEASPAAEQLQGSGALAMAADQAAFELNHQVGTLHGEDETDTPETEDAEVNGVDAEKDAIMTDA